MKHQLTAALRQWWFSLLLLGVMLSIALVSEPTQAVLNTYYYYVMLPFISR
jgi:uncharacterized membrane protein